MAEVRPDELAGAVLEVLQTFNHNVVTAADEAAVEAAKNAVKELRITSPRRTGKYERGWTYRKEKSGKVIVYNRARPWLTHLLENGHPIHGTRGDNSDVSGYSKPRPHIAPAEQHAITAFEHFLKEKIEKGK